MKMRLPPFVDPPSPGEATRARVAARKALRAELQRRRNYGLRQRNRERLARARAGTQIAVEGAEDGRVRALRSITVKRLSARLARC